MTELVIDIHNLTKVFNGKTVVCGLNLQVNRGNIFGFLGSNGSGKTTTIRMLAGLLTPSSGSGTCLGLDIYQEISQIKSRIGYMPQKFCLYDLLTVEENMQFIGELYELPNLGESINREIAQLSLEPYRYFRANQLSEGWKQRLSLACALMHQPELLFLDEPTAGIDPMARKEFWDYLHLLALERRVSIFVSTHHMEDAEKCTHLAYIQSGTLLYCGATDGIVPFSGVVSYATKKDRDYQASLAKKITSTYANASATYINNELRISSQNRETLNQIHAEFPAADLFEVTPTLEEVIIGLSA